MNKISYDAVWADLIAMARANMGILSILAGVFLLLPNFAQLLFAPPPQIERIDMNAIKTLNDYIRDNFLVLLLCNLPVWLGSAAILALLLDPRRLTVGEALAGAATLLIGVILLDWFKQFAIYGGLFLLVLPGVYLVGRLAVAGAAQMAERLFNPFKAFARSFELTRSNGWRIAGLVVILWVCAAILTAAINFVIGIVLTLVMPLAALPAAAALLRSILGAATALLILLLGAAIYRQLAPANPAA